MRVLLLTLALLLPSAGSAMGQAHLLIVSGLGGEPKYVEDFHSWGTMMRDAAIERLGVPRERVTYLAEDPARDPERIDGISRLEEVEGALARIVEASGPEEGVLLLLIGHGSSDSRGSRINLPGPDLTAEHLATLLGTFPASQPLVVVNSASASGDFHEPLAGENRTIITATRSGMERNETIFGRYFVEAFQDDAADADRDGRITVAEAFDYATRETERSYQSSNQLQLEHSRMEGDVQLARTFHLGGSSASAIPPEASAEVRALYEERDELQRRVEALRMQSGRLDAEEYQRELERLLLELARTNRSIQQSEEER